MTEAEAAAIADQIEADEIEFVEVERSEFAKRIGVGEPSHVFNLKSLR